MSTILRAINSLSPRDMLALAVGIGVGVTIILLIRARQMWTQRGAFGFDVYTADRRRRTLTRLSIVGVIAVIVVVGIYGWRSLHEQLTSAGPELSVAPVQPPVETNLVIPKLAIDVPMIEAPFVAQEWDISRLTTQVAHLAGTAYPGESGNVVLAGHITIPGAGWGPFQKLDTLQVGDMLFIEQGDITYTYRVAEKKLVEPTEVQVAYPTPDSRLTLITCAGWSEITQNYAQRIVVVAEEVK